MNTRSITAALLPKQQHCSANESFDAHPEIQAKLAELKSRTISFNRELLRLTAELTELRHRLSLSR